MSETTAEYRKYLEPRTLARISSLDLRARLIVEGLMSGMHRSPYQGSSVEFAQHRQYVAGDDIRHVDWKVFGKTDKIYLKQYLEETNLHLLCIVDASESMGYTSIRSGGDWWSKYDHATAIATALWKIITHELAITPRLKKTNTARILDQLAEKLHHRSLIVLLSDFFDDA